MKSNIICCICVTGMLLMVMASTPVSAMPGTKNFGEAKAELYSDDNLYVFAPNIQNWTYDESDWQDIGFWSLYFEVSTKWIDKTTNADNFKLLIEFEVFHHPNGPESAPTGSERVEIDIEDNSANWANDQWFYDTLSTGPWPSDASGFVVYQCYLFIDLWNYDTDPEEHDSGHAHWWVFTQA